MTTAPKAVRKLTLQEIAEAINGHMNFPGSAFRSSNFVILQYTAPERETALTAKDAQAYLTRLDASGYTDLRHDEEVN